MAILRKQQRTTYTVIDNDAVRNTDLSWRATGLLVYLLSLPDDWSVNVTDLSRRKVDGKTATRSTMQELEDAGYLTVEVEFDGTLRRHIWIVSEEPQTTRKGPEVADGRAPDGRPPDGPPPDTLTLRKNQDEVTSNEVTISEIATMSRDPIWDTLVELYGTPSPSRESVYGMIVKYLKRVGATPSEMKERSGLIIAEWGREAATALSLYNNWSRFDAAISSVTDADLEELERQQHAAATVERLAE